MTNKDTLCTCSHPFDQHNVGGEVCQRIKCSCMRFKEQTNEN